MAPRILASSVPARPALESRCTCVWPVEYERQAAVVEAYAAEQARVDALSNPLSTVAAVPGQVYDTVAGMMPGAATASSSTMPGGLGVPGVTAPGMNRSQTGNSAYTMPVGEEQEEEGYHAMAHPHAAGHHHHPQGAPVNARLNAGPSIQFTHSHPQSTSRAEHMPTVIPNLASSFSFTKQRQASDHEKGGMGNSHHGELESYEPAHTNAKGGHRDRMLDTDKRIKAKTSHLKTGMSMTIKGDTPARKMKRIFRLTPEMKLRNLLACREDLVVILRQLIPSYQQAETISPIAKSDTRLCDHCTTLLAHALYHCPARLDAYIREGSTQVFLAFVDDAVASLNNDVRMERVSHRDLEYTLRAELAVIEWRMAMKLAGIHKKNRIADLFPLKVGQFAELNVEQEGPPTKPEGLLKRGALVAAKMVGLSGSDREGTHKQIARGAAGNVTAMGN